jgi:ferredoxin
MADKENRNPENAPGAWYVDDTCIGCEACASEAPAIFAMANGLAIVAKQPGTEAETAAAESAMSACPVESIGNDG